MLRRALTLTALAAAGTGSAAGVASAAPGATAAVVISEVAGHREPAGQLVNLDRGTVVVYEDGRVYRRADMGDWYVPEGFAAASPRGVPRMAPPAPPGAYEWATLSDDAVDDLIEQIEDLGLLDDDLDFGDPLITDSPSSDLVLDIDGERVEHSVYAPNYSDGLTAEEQANRRAYNELRAALFELEDNFASELSKFSPYVPDEWIVRMGGYWSGEVDRPWPLAGDPVDGDCVELPNDGETDTATGGYLLDGEIIVADATLPNDPRCTL
ncbi:hypothetical protein [Desertimonas flava]|uniref:hypothetical protein n=1 Tax=Desertimonas flava TaxID=2064846 RepID=UPI000E34D6CB|nr:hypothetical protein [Desertimonas flava]